MTLLVHTSTRASFSVSVTCRVSPGASSIVNVCVLGVNGEAGSAVATGVRRAIHVGISILQLCVEQWIFGTMYPDDSKVGDSRDKIWGCNKETESRVDFPGASDCSFCG